MSETSTSSPLAEIDTEYVADVDRAFVHDRLRLERTRLEDPRHLVDRVIRPTEFDWDFEPIHAGFLDLAAPFLVEPSGAGALFHALLREYGQEKTGSRHAVVILEFAHFATRINDHFDYHDAFADHAPDQATAEKLVQLRYGAQWLNNYPRWLIVEDELKATPEARIGGHRWGSQSFTATGISRACFVRFAHRGFARVGPEQWLAIAPMLLCELVISPAVMATLLAGRSDEDLAVVKRAFSHLAVALKLRLERKSLAAGLRVGGAPEHDVLLPMQFPGLAVTRDAIAADLRPLSGTRFPRVKDVARALAESARSAGDLREHVASYRHQEQMYAGHFADELNRAGLLPLAARSLASAFESE